MRSWSWLVVFLEQTPFSLLSSCVRLARMGKRFSLVAFLLFAWVAHANCQSGGVPGAEWKQLTSPEQAGWSTQKLAKIRDYIEEIGSTSAMIVQHGVVVAAWGDIAHRSNLHSCRKSLLNGSGEAGHGTRSTGGAFGGLSPDRV